MNIDVSNSSLVNWLKLPVQQSEGIMFGTWSRIFHNPGFHFQVFFPKEQLECVVHVQDYRAQTLKTSLHCVANFVNKRLYFNRSYLQQEQLFLSSVNGFRSSKSSCCCVNLRDF